MSRSARLGVVAIAIVAAQAMVSLFAHKGSELTAFCDVSQTLLMAIATAAMFRNLRRSSGSARTFWLLMGAGLGLWLLSNASWTWLEVFRREPVPNPFDGDVILFVHIVPMLAALAIRPHKEDGQGRFHGLDLALLLVWWLYLYVITVLPWQYVAVDVARYGYNFNLVYLAETATFVVLAALLWHRSSGEWKRTYAHFFGAGMLYMLASQFASLAIDEGKYYTGSWYDVPLVAAIVWFGWIGFTAPATVGAKAAETEEGVLNWPAFLAMVAVLSTPLAAVWLASTHEFVDQVKQFRLVATLVVILIMSATVFIRQTLLDRRLIQLLRESRQSLEALQNLQSQLLQSEKMAALGRLVAGAAHEINNPLTAITGYAEMLRDRGPDAATLGQKIQEQCRRTKALVSDLLTFAQEQRTAKTQIQIEGILSSAVRLKEPELAAKNIHVELNGAESLPLISGDGSQLLSVFLRIINNAEEAMHAKGGVLRVNASAANGSVIVEFQDNGPGVSEPDRIFDPFYTTKPIGKGTGLGLSVCYGIMQSHGGEITCRNNPGGGAAFRLRFPVAQAAAASFS